VFDSTKVLSDSSEIDDSLPTSKDALKSVVNYTAKDSIFFDVEAKVVHLWGEAKMDYEKIKLNAAYTKIDFKSSTLLAAPMSDSANVAYGKPDFSDGDKVYKSDTLKYNFKSKKGKLIGLATNEGEGIIYATQVKKDPDNSLYGQDCRYSTCIDTLHPHFYVHVKRLKIIPKKQIVTGPANLVIEDVPTPAYLPFGFFPIQQGQKRGLVFPSYGFSAYGFFLRDLGYYLPLGHHHDLKLLTNIYTNGSWRAAISTNYNYRYKFSGDALFELNNLHSGDKEVPSDYKQQNIYRVFWRHNIDGKARPGTTFNINIDAQSSAYNTTVPTASYNDLTRNVLTSNISYGKTFASGKYNLTTSARYTQNTTTKDITLQLPNINFSVASFSPFARKEQLGSIRWYENIRIGYNMTMQNQAAVKEANLFSNTLKDSFHNGIVHSIPLQLPTLKLLKYFTLTPSVNYNEYWYSKYTTREYDTLNNYKLKEHKQLSRAYNYSTSASLSTRIYGFYNINRGNIIAIRHSMVPNISFNYSPDFGAAKYNNYRYEHPDSIQKYKGRYSIYESSVIGGPGQGANGSISFGINNNFEMKYKTVNDSGKVKSEKMSILDNLNITGNYNFLADSFKLSNFGVNGSTKIWKRVDVNFSGQFDPYLYIGSRRMDIYKFDLKTLDIARFTRGHIALSTSLNKDMFSKKKAATKESTYGTKTEQKQVKDNPDDYVNFNIPWNLSLGYTLDYSQSPVRVNDLRQYVTFRGSMVLTANWSADLNFGYDIKQRALTTTEITIHRNLHCWEANFTWVPVGPLQRYLFTIKAKSQLLQDLKLNKRRDPWDK
jgi:hypothetical protein